MDENVRRTVAAVESAIAEAIDHELFEENSSTAATRDYAVRSVDAVLNAPGFAGCTLSLDEHAREYQAADREALIDAIYAALLAERDFDMNTRLTLEQPISRIALDEVNGERSLADLIRRD